MPDEKRSSEEEKSENKTTEAAESEQKAEG